MDYASSGEKKIEIGRTIFALISINGHYCAIPQNLFWPPFWNGIESTFFQILFQKSNCILQRWAKFRWKKLLGKWFFTFWSRDLFREMQIRFSAAILKRNIFFSVLFADICLSWVSAHTVRISFWNSYGKVNFRGGGPCGPPPPWPCAPTGVKSTLGTLSVNRSNTQQIEVRCGLTKHVLALRTSVMIELQHSKSTSSLD